MRTNLAGRMRLVVPVTLMVVLSVCAMSWGRGPMSLASPQSARINTGETCLNCHRIEVGFSHPVGVFPSMAIPRNLPLVNGRIGCVTCHEGGTGADHTKAINRTTSMLRDNGIGSLCASCHLSTGSQSWHKTQGRAHLRWQGREFSKTQVINGGLDQESHDCLSCHDGTITSDVTRASDNLGIPDHAKGHPIGQRVRGTLVETPINTGSFRPAFALDPRVRLFDGAVGCGSCHSPYSHEEKGLVMSNFGSRLCLTCHQI